MADGTAPKCGRVGSCHIYFKPFRFSERLFLFLVINETIIFYRRKRELLNQYKMNVIVFPAGGEVSVSRLSVQERVNFHT